MISGCPGCSNKCKGCYNNCSGSCGWCSSECVSGSSCSAMQERKTEKSILLPTAGELPG